MNFLQLKYFQEVARLEHMTKAAESLNVSQPSISNTISRLEKELGVPLFVRQGRQIKLTPYGQTFLKRVNRSFFELDEGVAELKAMAGLERGYISIATTLASIMPFLLKDYLTSYPQNKIIQKQAFSTEDIKKQLINNEIDLCISWLPIIDEDIEWLPLKMEQIYISVPMNHRFAHRKKIDLAELAEEKFISLTPEYTFRKLTDDFCYRAGFEPNISIQITDASSLHQFVHQDYGVTFTPVFLIPSTRNLNCVHIPIHNPVCQCTIGIAWHKNHSMSQSAKEFIEFTASFFRDLVMN